MIDYNWQRYKRLGFAEAKPYVYGDDMTDVSISAKDLADGSPKTGDMIARNPDSHKDRWLIARTYFEKNFETTPSEVVV